MVVSPCPCFLPGSPSLISKDQILMELPISVRVNAKIFIMGAQYWVPGASLQLPLWSSLI